MALQIPKEDFATIADLKALTDASVRELIAALNAAPLVLDTSEIAKQIAKSVPSIPLDRLDRMLETLYSLYYIRELSGVRRPRFLADLIDGIQDEQKLSVPIQDVPKLRARFEKLLNIDSLNTISKAGRLQRDGERLYCDGKILSDIRPVFGSKPTVTPPGAVVTHTLRIGYHEGEDHKDFFL